MSSYQLSSILIVSGALLFAIILLSATNLVRADVEFDNLALRFQNGFDLMSKTIGNNGAFSGGPPKTIGEADKQMRELYTVLERNLMDARQRAANARSSVTFDTIEKLNLV